MIVISWLSDTSKEKRPFMEAEEVISLLDSYWFGQKTFKKFSVQPSLRSPDLNFQENPSKPRILSQLSIYTRSLSDHLMSMSSKASLIPDSHSPDSVLYSSSEKVPRTPQLPDQNIKKKGLSKSLSKLEFEELKGFMDLGFVFSEEDKKSSLVDIIPGLQRIGRKEKDEEEERKSSISRPYLSEAWKDLDIKRRENPLKNWRIPSLGNEIDMKDNLKWWAHTVASTVRSDDN